MKIRYRVWDPDTSTMWDPDGHSPFDMMSDGDLYYQGHFEKKCTTLLSTGLNDCEGTEIFEGDILATKSDPDPQLTGEVIFRDGGFRVAWQDCEFDTRVDTLVELTRIIGNIHENPELLEE